MSKSIVLITCYFGQFPWYFDFFLKSCQTNPTVNYLIFSDCKLPNLIPENVKFVNFTLQSCNNLFTEKLGFEVQFTNPYKLCDFKPAYGFLFSSYIKEYDFWGVTDIDVIFGRIREFITNEILHTNEFISVRNDYPTGSFMLFKIHLKLICSSKKVKITK